MPPKGQAAQLLGLGNRIAHCEDTQGDLRQQVQVLTQRLNAQQQVGDPENIFLNCKECETRLQQSAKVLEDFVEATCVRLDAQKDAIYREQQTTRQSIVKQYHCLQDELQVTRKDCEGTIARMEDVRRYCRRSLDEFHAVKDQLDSMAAQCDDRAPICQATSPVDPHKFDKLRDQVARMSRRLSRQTGGQMQSDIDHLQTLTHDLTSEVVAHDSMLQDLRVNAADYHSLRGGLSRAFSAERDEVIAEARTRVLSDSRRTRSLSISQRISGAQQVAALTHGYHIPNDRRLDDPIRGRSRALPQSCARADTGMCPGGPPQSLGPPPASTLPADGTAPRCLD